MYVRALRGKNESLYFWSQLNTVSDIDNLSVSYSCLIHNMITEVQIQNQYGHRPNIALCDSPC